MPPHFPVIHSIINSLPAGNFACYFDGANLLSADFFQNNILRKNRNTITVSNNLDPDQAQPDMGTNCLQKLGQIKN